MTDSTHPSSEPTKNVDANVDAAEIAKFEALARRWWDRNGEFKSLHDINPLRLNYIEKRAALPERRILDVGCGGGILSEGMAHRGAYVTGLDMGDAPLQVARLHALETELDINYQKNTVEALAASTDDSYDIITCLEMLEHVPDPESIIQACMKLLKPGGHLFLSTINRNPKSYLFAILGAEYVLNLLPRGTHDYAKLIRPSELARWLRLSGFELQDVTGMSFNPLTQQYKLTSDADVNYLVHATVPNDE
jgi:2-polyprenyl-6-hydroxyphenyl methylase/3-demethylubiquinone-9 3-methyltransferase